MVLRKYFSLQTRGSIGDFILYSRKSPSSSAMQDSFVPTSDGLQAERQDSAQASISEYDKRQTGTIEQGIIAREPSSGFIAYFLPDHSIPSFFNGNVVPLQLPDPLPPVGVSISSKFDIRSLSQAHFRAFRAAGSSDSVDSFKWTIGAATKQVKILRKAFPLVNSRNALLCMCAWFHLFCFFDDATESMPAKEARTVMKHSMYILEVACQTQTTARKLSLTMSPIQRAKVLYTLWLSSRLPSSGLVAGATYLFVQQARRLLGPEALQRVAGKIIVVFEGYYREISCRERIDTLSLREYTKLRSVTIGLAPCWEILRDTFFTGPETHLAEMATYVLESHVAAVVGLQNDLVGVANDRANGDRMNYVLLLAERHSLTVGQALTSAIELHNWTVREAMLERRRVKRTVPFDWKGSGGMRLYLNCMLGFMTTHFLWASNADHYKPGYEG